MLHPNDSKSASSARNGQAGEVAFIGLIAAAICAFYLWTASSNTVHFEVTGNRNDYYNLLSRGFLQGHLSMDVAPLAHPPTDPSEMGLGGMPFLLDASFYRGKYYLYFGPTAVMTVFLPYRLLTRQEISDNLVAALFASAGFLVSLRLLWLVRRRYFPNARGWLMPVLTILLGLGNVCAVMLRHPMFYEATIGCAFCFQTSALLGIWRALTAEGKRSRIVALTVASLAMGLSVGARANYAFGCIVLGFLVVWFWRKRNRDSSTSGQRFIPLVWATVVPVSLCAIGLMAYNYARFGRVLEFGVSYQFTYRPVFGPEFFLHNLKLYYFSLPELSWYFPFTLPVHETNRPATYVGFEHLHGQVWSTIWLLPVLGAAGWIWTKRFATERALAVLFSCALFLYANNLFVLLCLGGRANRYMVDFQPALMFLGAVSVFVWSSSWRWPSWGRFGAAAVLVLAVTVIGLHNIFSSFQLYELLRYANPPTYNRLAMIFNRPSDWAGRWLYPRLGPIQMQIQFSGAPKGEIEPLVVTGSAEYCDFLAVQHLDRDWVRFVFFHHGYQEIASAPVAVGTEKIHDLKIDLGSLYPPLAHPFFEQFSRGDRALIKHTVRVQLDGREVFSAQHDLYDASPGRVYIGENPLALYTTPRFDGTIGQVRRLGLGPLIRGKTQPAWGALFLRVTFPTPMAARGTEPLVVTGEKGRGDAVLVQYVDDRHLKFGLDHWGGAGGFSGPIELDSTIPHAVEVSLGSLFPPLGDPKLSHLSLYELDQLKNLIRIKLDGHEVFRMRATFHEAQPNSVDLGANSISMSSCVAEFGGQILEVLRMPLQSGAESENEARAIGPIRFRVRFPVDQVGRTEPLITTGRAGRGDLVAVTFLDDKKLKLSFDHWGSPALFSEPITIDYGADHVIDLDLGSLYPVDEVARLSEFFVNKAEERRRQLQIRLDGMVVLAAKSDFHAASAEEIEIGANQIGGTGVEALFGGKISAFERLGFGPKANSARKEDFGPVALDVLLPKDQSGQSVPLVVTGRTGAGDGIVLTYVDSGHIQLSWDHWGTGGPASAVLPINYTISHQFEVEMGSLYPENSQRMHAALSPEEISARRRTLRVKLDGNVVLSGEGAFYPADKTEVEIGSNPIGLSSATPLFTGAIEQLQRPGKNPPER